MAPPDSYFPIGVFEDGNIVAGDKARFAAMLHDLKARGLDSVMFTNSSTDRDAGLLDVADELGAGVYMLPAFDLNDSWWSSGVPADLATARRLAKPIVGRLGAHASFKGYIVRDEPGLDSLDKVALMTQAFRDLDPSRPATPILIGTDRVEPIFRAAQPQVLLIDVYPVGKSNPPCDFTMSGFGYSDLDFVSYTRLVVGRPPTQAPLWMILQTHQFIDSLRQPTAAEVRAQHWMAIGEGAKGIFWFIYASQQGWVGLADNPPLFAEVARLAGRVAPLRETLLGLHKTDDVFQSGGAGQPYLSTLASADGTRRYAVAVNRDCKRSQKLAIAAPGLTGRLKDLETSRMYGLGAPITFTPGDGKIFELVTMPVK
jgi:hypothetical protein